jgi:hypothetical protein
VGDEIREEQALLAAREALFDPPAVEDSDHTPADLDPRLHRPDSLAKVLPR